MSEVDFSESELHDKTGQNTHRANSSLEGTLRGLWLWHIKRQFVMCSGEGILWLTLRRVFWSVVPRRGVCGKA